MKLLILFAIFIVLARANDEEKEAKIRAILSRLPKYSKPLASSRIVGGSPAVPHSRPFQVFMIVPVLGETYYCSGTLISSNFVLTAAHCVFWSDYGTIILGAHNITADESTQVTRSVTIDNFRIHPGWDMNFAVHDIATIELNEPVEFNEYIQPIKLPNCFDARNKFIGRKAVVSGWGVSSDATYDDSPVPILREVSVRIMSNFGCQLMFNKVEDSFPIQSTHICSSGRGGVNPCNDDSGGPITVGDKQVGIVSFGYIPYCEAGYPSAYTRITSYLKWIEANSDVKIKCY